MRSVLLLAALVLLDPPDAVGVKRQAIVARALEYATHHWRASPANVLHGEDPGGIRVDTAERRGDKGDGFLVDGSENLGVPYQWGGFASIAEFDAGVAAGRPAGHVIENEAARASTVPVGVDCSGLVSRCWNLPVKLSTGLLPGVCRQLSSSADLLPGDVLNRSNGHVLVFVEFAGPDHQTARVIEAAIPKVRERVIDLVVAEREGFEPLRYAPLDPAWPQVELAAAEYTSGLKPVPFVASPEPPAIESPLASIASFDRPQAWSVGTFVRYRVLPRNPSARSIEWTVSVARVSADTITLVCSLVVGDATIDREMKLPSAPNMHDVLQLTLSMGGPFLLDSGGWTAQAGKWRPPDEVASTTDSPPASRGTGTIRGALDLGRSRYPIEQTFECVRSDLVPVLGIVSLETVRTGEPRAQRLELIAFGRARR